MVNHYDLLNLEKDASMKDVAVAYRKLAKIHHPDRGGTASMMIQLNIAYEILRDEEARREYDEKLVKSTKEHHEDNFKASYDYEKDGRTYYWQTWSFDSTYSNDLVTDIWKELKGRNISRKKYPYLFKKNLKIDIKAYLESLLSEFNIPSDEYQVLQYELFPLFAKAGYITARVINQQLPNIQDHWDRLEEILIKQRGFKGSIFYRIENDNHDEVEEIFPFEFNIIGKKFLEDTLNKYQNQYPTLNLNNTKLVIVLAKLFVYGYTVTYSKAKIEKEKLNRNYGTYALYTFVYIYDCFPLTTKFFVILLFIAISTIFNGV